MALLSSISGVPPLQAGIVIAIPSLLQADGVGGLYATPDRWGLYQGGGPAITFDTFVSIDYRQGWSIADYPLEDGAFQSYDKVALPFDVRVRFASGGSEANRAALIQSITAIAPTLNKYSVVTPEVTYRNVCVQHYDYRRTSTNGVGLIVVEMWLLEIREGGQSSGQSGLAPVSGVATNTAGATPFDNAPGIFNAADASGMSSYYAGALQTYSVPGTVAPVQ